MLMLFLLCLPCTQVPLLFLTVSLTQLIRSPFFRRVGDNDSRWDTRVFEICRGREVGWKLRLQQFVPPVTAILFVLSH